MQETFQGGINVIRGSEQIKNLVSMLLLNVAHRTVRVKELANEDDAFLFLVCVEWKGLPWKRLKFFRHCNCSICRMRLLRLCLLTTNTSHASMDGGGAVGVTIRMHHLHVHVLPLVNINYLVGMEDDLDQE